MMLGRPCRALLVRAAVVHGLLGLQHEVLEASHGLLQVPPPLPQHYMGAGGHRPRLEEYFFQVGVSIVRHDSEPGPREKCLSGQRKWHSSPLFRWNEKFCFTSYHFNLNYWRQVFPSVYLNAKIKSSKARNRDLRTLWMGRGGGGRDVSQISFFPFLTWKRCHFSWVVPPNRQMMNSLGRSALGLTGRKYSLWIAPLSCGESGQWLGPFLQSTNPRHGFSFPFTCWWRTVSCEDKKNPLGKAFLFLYLTDTRDAEESSELQ